jgi:hypothetical protein
VKCMVEVMVWVSHWYERDRREALTMWSCGPQSSCSPGLSLSQNHQSKGGEGVAPPWPLEAKIGTVERWSRKGGKLKYLFP